MRRALSDATTDLDAETEANVNQEEDAAENEAHRDNPSSNWIQLPEGWMTNLEMDKVINTPEREAEELTELHINGEDLPEPPPIATRRMAPRVDIPDDSDEDHDNPSQTNEGSQSAPAGDPSSDDLANRTPKTAGVHIAAAPKVPNKVQFGGVEFEPLIVYTQPEIFVTTQNARKAKPSATTKRTRNKRFDPQALK